MPFRQSTRATVAMSVALFLAACGGQEQEREQSGGPDTEAAVELHEAQPLSVKDATLLAESSESGTYSELVTVQHSEQVRASTELDKPECLDAANSWSALDTVRAAPASVAAYEWGPGTVSHILVWLDEDTATEALATEPPESCSEYTATYEDGSSSEYGVDELDLPTVGDASRSFVIRVSDDNGENHMYTVMYRNGGLLGTTSIMGAGDPAVYERMLTDFSEAAIERQGQMLG
ncbi:hypothetical protein [Nocardiopsis alkaliphila]|uniref:hypothetical protein n=1 Tax=Nocardiopsis alkaliphila TaxID=225762 RepID=UPI00034B3AA5|nr:hypothetical protein [Nocardiopsis alkaliphila]